MRKLQLFVLTLLMILGTYAAAAAPVATTPPPLEDAETVLEDGYLSGGTVNAGFRYQIGGGLFLDGSYVRPIITLAPLELYNVLALKGEVYDITQSNFALAAMAGFGVSYVDDQGVGFFAELRLWETWKYGNPLLTTPEIAVAYVTPIEFILP